MNRARVILNGDDFGVSEEVNHAMVAAFRRGVLSSCSLIVTGDAAPHAVKLARENPGLAVGLHLVTVLGKSVLPPKEIPALVDRNGYFPSDPAIAGLRYFFCPTARKQLKRELSAQFEQFRATGLSASHVDSHLHMHVHPVVFDAAVDLARKHGIRGMRLPEDDLWTAVRFDGRLSAARMLTTLVFRLLCLRMKRVLRREGFAFAPRVFGHLMSGGMTEEYVLHVLRHLPVATNEIYFHPALCHSVERGGATAAQLAKEFEILVSPRVKEAIRTGGIDVINYSNLKAFL